MTARPMTEGEREEALRIANNIVGSGTVQHYSPSAAEYKLADALLSTSAAERGMREALPLAVAALEEAEAILGGEYGDQHAVLCERMADLRAALSGIEGEDEQATRAEDGPTAPTDRL